MIIKMLLLVYCLGCIWFWYVGMVDHEKYSDADFITANELKDEDLVR
jgi:hypothetical protein